MRSSGFTLIELSIVLVIIGLLVGVVFVGRDLIRAAEIRATISQVEKTKTAIATFKTKYNCIPGDCPNATDYFSDAINGNGDGQIFYNPATDLSTEYYPLEPYNIWNQLGEAGLVPGNFIPMDDGAYDQGLQSQDTLPAPLPGTFLDISYVNAGNMGTAITNSANYIILSKIFYGDIFNQGYTQNGALNLEELIDPNDSGGPNGIYPQDAYAIDSKIDDGLPLTGQVVVYHLDINSWIDCTAYTNDTFNNNSYNFSPSASSRCIEFFLLGL